MMKWDPYDPDGRNWTHKEREEYERSCWACRGMSGKHYETEIVCEKHNADRALLKFLWPKQGILIEELNDFSDLLDNIIEVRKKKVEFKV